MERVEGRTAFVTGGASGIGLGMATVFARNGMKVVLADIRQEALEEAAHALSREGLPVHPVLLDVTDREGYARAADEAERVFGRIHVLCNNAGIGVTGPMIDATYDDWDWMMSVMVGGVINGVQTVLPRIRRHGEGGHVVNTASMSGAFASGIAGIYITAKYAVVGMAEALRTELAGENIGVSAFLPGGVRTNIHQSHRLRPPGLNTGYAELDHRREAMAAARRDQPNAPPTAMDIIEVGERVLRGIRRNDLYIVTHAEFRAGLQARCDALMRAFPDEPIEESRLAFIRGVPTLGYNPIYDDQRPVPPFQNGKPAEVADLKK